MSEKSKYVALFNENYLNEHFLRNTDQGKKIILDQDMITCKGCGQLFERGQWIFTKPSYKGKARRYHLRCAARLLIVNKQEIMKYRNAFYALALSAWLMEFSRYFILGQS